MLVFDIESLGVDFKNPAWIHNDEEKRIHCIVIEDRETGKQQRFRGHNIEQGLRILMSAGTIGGHNVHGFDIPYIQKLYPWFKPQGMVRDSQTESEMWYPANDLRSKDFGAEKKYGTWIERKWFGRHSLGAWGARLKCPKDEYQQRCKDKGIDPWAEWNQDMEDYCAQDVTTNCKLFDFLESKFDYVTAVRAVALENKVKPILVKQTQWGVRFDKQKAVALHTQLAARQQEINAELQAEFPPFYMRDGQLQTPKRSMKRWKQSDDGNQTRKVKSTAIVDADLNKVTTTSLQTGWYEHITEGGQFVKIKLKEFNASSRNHISNRLMKVYGWKPTEMTPDGSPKVDEAVLKDLPYPAAKLLTEYLLLDKRLGQIAEGNQAWLRQERNGRIHGQVSQNGTRTTRGSHHSPNLGQVPKVGKPHGAECRECFGPSEGRKQVGCDLSGIELRALGHYMARFDGGAYADLVVNGDVHEATRIVIDFNSRDNTKTAEYAYLYGAGDFKLGLITLEDMTEEQRKEMGKATKRKVTALGKDTRSKLIKGLNGMEPLLNACYAAAGRKKMKALDGRYIAVPSKHSALNTLLQHLGGELAKAWMVEIQERLEEAGLVEPLSWIALPTDKVHQMLWVHDEVQQDCDADVAEQVAEIDVEAARVAGEFFNLRVKVDAEAKIGGSWRECH